MTSRNTSPVPRTRVEKVDDTPSHGELPGSPAYDMRKQDAVPDELEILPEGRLSKRNSSNSLRPPLSPEGTPIPLTVVEKVDPDAPSHGEIPGTAAYERRQADAAPDQVFKALDVNVPHSFSPSHSPGAVRPGPIPATIVTRADSIPSLNEVPGAILKGPRVNEVLSSTPEDGVSAEGKP